METEKTGRPFPAGCSALSWDTADGRHLLGRNLDFTGLAPGTAVQYVPRGIAYETCAGGGAGARCQARYAALGTGLLLAPSLPLLYEGVNECGLMGGQLYYRNLARYAPAPRPGTAPLQPPVLLYHLLAQCATVEEAALLLSRRATLVCAPLLGQVPPLHWVLRDRSGETVVVEPDVNGLHLYRETVGVLTNSPGYPWHLQHLRCFSGLQDLDRDGPDVAGLPAPSFSGTGAQGLPGDWTSPSRFVRLAFLRRYALPGADEPSGVARMFRLLQSVAFPLGPVRLDGPAPAWDAARYTAVLCGESLRYYWTTYENQRIRFVDLPSLLPRSEPLQFALEHPPELRACAADAAPAKWHAVQDDERLHP